MKFVYLFLAAALLAVFGLAWKSGVFNFSLDQYKKADVAVRTTQFRVDVADDMAKREKGLGGREGLASDEGMLFVFDGAAIKSFWMRDVSFPIDIVWISGDKIVGFAKDVQPEVGVPLHRLAKYRSPQPVDKVLEIAAGRVDEVGMEIGDGVNIKFEE